MAHRLELALLELQKVCPMVEDVSGCLHLVWKTYYYSPKSKWELHTIGAELEARIYRSAPVKGTRWVPHIDRALQVFLQGKKGGDLATDHGHYAAVCIHVERIATSSKNTDVKNRAAKLHKLMITKNFVEFAHFMIDVFGEVASLSLKLQTKALILPTAISSIDTRINTIKSMKERPIASGALKQFQLRVEEQNDTTLMFQGIELKGGSAAGRFGSNVTLKQAIVKTIDVTVKELRARFDNLLGKNEDEQENRQ